MVFEPQVEPQCGVGSSGFGSGTAALEFPPHRSSEGPVLLEQLERLLRLNRKQFTEPRAGGFGLCK